MAPEERLQQQTIIDRENQYLVRNYGRYPLAVRRGRGSYLFGLDGKRYLDLLTGIGVNALGHGHPRILKTLKEQAGLLIHCSNLYYHEYQGLLAERIAQVSGLARSFFCNSGTEAVECALKMARSHGRAAGGGKSELVAFENSFHGRTLGALSVTGQKKYREPFEPLLPEVRFVPYNDEAALESAIGGHTAGVIVEAIQGEGGIYPLSERLARRLRELCDQHGALLIFDEIQCGVGRAGTHFSYQAFDPPVLPDVMVAAKPLALGLPLGVVAANEKAAATIQAGMHGSTFGGGALACRVALQFFEVLEEVLPNVRARSEQFRVGLNELARKYEFIKEVRVHGLMIGVELRMPGKQLVLDAIQAGLLINCTHDVVLRMLPPYTISEQETEKGLKLLDRVLRKGVPLYQQSRKQE